MDNPSSQSFDTTKVLQLISFICDEGYSIDFALEQTQAILNENDDTTYLNKLTRHIRLAWSVIKCGIKYHNKRFHMKGIQDIEGLDLNTTLLIIFVNAGFMYGDI